VAKFDDGRKYPWGNDEPADATANVKRDIKDPADVITTPVGSKSPKGDSKLGACDMVGNVAEFCNDWYHEDYTVGVSDTDPAGPPPCLLFNVPFFKQFRPAHVVRGGSFMTDPNFRREYGVPFVIDSVMHPEAFINSYRCYEIDGFSRQIEGFRIVKVTATDKTKTVSTTPLAK
jgi:formylglycine-generating enzyme required for sulfatase activity